MNKTKFYLLVGLILSLSFFSSCNKKKQQGGRTDTYSSGVIKFASDESFSPIIDEEREVFELIYKDAKVTPIYTNELDAVNMLMKDSIQLVIAARNFTAKELKNLRDRRFMPRAIPIAYDGLALIVNKTNNDTCITVNDIKRILSGKVKNWKDIYPNSNKGEILVVFDNKQSSTVHWCVDSILGGVPINSPNIMAAKTSAEVIEYVEQTPNAIGVIGSNWLNDKRDTTNLTFNKNIHVMSVSRKANATEYNSWKPYQAYLLDGRYPLVRTIYALLNDPFDGLPWGFARFIESPKGQLIIFKSGLLPVKGEINIRQVNVSED